MKPIFTPPFINVDIMRFLCVLLNSQQVTTTSSSDNTQKEDTTASISEKKGVLPEFAGATLFLKSHELLIPWTFVRIDPVR